MVSRYVKSEAQRRLMAHGVHAGQQFILECLWQRDGLSPGEVAAQIHVEAPTVTRALQRMTASGLVQLNDDARDGRKVRIWLTPRGEQLRHVVPQAMADLQREALAPLSVEEQLQLVELLRQVGTAVEALSHRGGEAPSATNT